MKSETFFTLTQGCILTTEDSSGAEMLAEGMKTDMLFVADSNGVDSLAWTLAGNLFLAVSQAAVPGTASPCSRQNIGSSCFPGFPFRAQT